MALNKAAKAELEALRVELEELETGQTSKGALAVAHRLRSVRQAIAVLELKSKKRRKPKE